MTGSVALALAGCSGSDVGAAPTPVVTPTAIPSSPTSTPSVSATPSPTSTGSAGPRPATTVPAPARAHTNAGAEAFLKFYMAQLNHAWQSADPKGLIDHSTPECATCMNFAETATSLHKRGHHYKADAIELGPTIALPRSTSELVYVQAPLKQNRVEILAIDGKVVRSTIEARSLTEAEVAWQQPGGWRIVGLRRVGEGA